MKFFATLILAAAGAFFSEGLLVKYVSDGAAYTLLLGIFGFALYEFFTVPGK